MSSRPVEALTTADSIQPPVRRARRAAKSARRRTTSGAAPTLRVERRMLRDGIGALAGSDEVGRGALCGPVTVAMVVVTSSTRPTPVGVRDSKLLTPEARERLAPLIRRWAPAYAVGHASSGEIDEIGVVAALRLAGHRAIAALDLAPDLVLLDGNHDYLSPPEQEELFAMSVLERVPPVVTMIKADLRCAAVAAASILAKTERDRIMVELAEDHPGYGWAENKGYAAPEHIEALTRLGPTPYHRLSWNLPGHLPGCLPGSDGAVEPRLSSAQEPGESLIEGLEEA